MKPYTKRYIIVADNAAQQYHVATWWCEWGSDGTAINGSPDAPCYTIIKTFTVADDATAEAIRLNAGK